MNRGKTPNHATIAKQMAPNQSMSKYLVQRSYKSPKDYSDPNRKRKVESIQTEQPIDNIECKQQKSSRYQLKTAEEDPSIPIEKQFDGVRNTPNPQGQQHQATKGVNFSREQKRQSQKNNNTFEEEKRAKEIYPSGGSSPSEPQEEEESILTESRTNSVRHAGKLALSRKYEHGETKRPFVDVC